MKRVAIVGASTNRAKFGNKSVRAHAAAGWWVVPVNPKGGEIEVYVLRNSKWIPVFKRIHG